MDPSSRFMEYAQDFEKTYLDDDWSRLEKHFAPDATYEVKPDPFTCRLVGPSAIFCGIKKSVDNFDRKCRERIVELTSVPVVDGEQVSVDWQVTYRREGAPGEMLLLGRSTARVRDGVIASLADELALTPEAGAWLAQHGQDMDGSYV